MRLTAERSVKDTVCLPWCTGQHSGLLYSWFPSFFDFKQWSGRSQRLF